MSVVLPAGFEAYLRGQFPASMVDELLARYEGPARSCIRLNPAKPYALPFEAHPNSVSPFGRALEERPVFTLDPGWHAGAYYVQEQGSMVVSEVLGELMPDGAQLVLDLCAAPGGKSTHLRSLLPDDCLLVSNEIIRTRVGRLEENLERWGHPGFCVISRDPEEIGRRCVGLFDAILVDAPCSGEGLFRKDEDAANEWSPAHVEFCAARQQRILADIWPALREGGLLVYSTCTFNQLEDEGAVRFLIDELGAELLPLPDRFRSLDTDSDTLPGTMRLLPDAQGTEGQFVAALRKHGKAEERDDLSRKDLQRLVAPKPNELALLQTYLPELEAGHFFINKEEWRLLPHPLRGPALRVLASIPIVSLGISVMEIKGKFALPLQGLATLAGHRVAAPRCELERSQALAFLKREDQRDSLDLEPGTYLVTHQNLGLGWLKAIQGGRINNLLPAGLRIRMDLPNSA